MRADAEDAGGTRTRRGSDRSMLIRFASTETTGRTSAGKRIRLTSAPEATITPAAWPSEDENQSHGKEPGEEEDRVPLHRHPEVDGEHEGVHQHQEQRVQERPEEPEERAAVARPELAQDQRPDQRAVSVQISQVSRHDHSILPPEAWPRSNAAAPVVEHVLDALAERDRGRPAGERPEPARVPDQEGDVDGAHALRRPGAPRSGARPARGSASMTCWIDVALPEAAL